MTQICAVLGGQWGDEGKGKLIDILSNEYDVIARATGGANAGHTVYVSINGEEKKFVFHLIPSGLIYDRPVGLIGNGCVVHLPTLFEEIEMLKAAGVEVESRLFISDRAQVLFDYHKEIDGLQEARRAGGGVGTTKRGIGPCYMDKIGRYGIRMNDLLDFGRFQEMYQHNLAMLKQQYGEFAVDSDQELAQLEAYLPRVKAMLKNGALFLDEQRRAGKKILFEGANGALLDIDHGTYPFVTSSNPTIGGLATGLGFPVQFTDKVVGIMKAYMTRVGGGPFPTEQLNELGDRMREQGGEYGSTTGRPRRCGWFDVVASKYSCVLNGFTAINLTKLDVLTGFDELKVAVRYDLHGSPIPFPASVHDFDKIQMHYETFPGWSEDLSLARSFDELPKNAQNYVLFLEEALETPIKYIGVGKNREAMIVR